MPATGIVRARRSFPVCSHASSETVNTRVSCQRMACWAAQEHRCTVPWKKWCAAGARRGAPRRARGARGGRRRAPAPARRSPPSGPPGRMRARAPLQAATAPACPAGRGPGSVLARRWWAWCPAAPAAGRRRCCRRARTGRRAAPCGPTCPRILFRCPWAPRGPPSGPGRRCATTPRSLARCRPRGPRPRRPTWPRARPLRRARCRTASGVRGRPRRARMDCL